MTERTKSHEELAQENDSLRAQLEEVTEVLTAIRTGGIDALLVETQDGEKIFTLQGADRPYRTFVETMNEGAATLTMDGTIVYCNRGFADLVGRQLEETFGRKLLDFVTSLDRPKFEALLVDGHDLGVRGEFTLEQPDGTSIPVRLSARHLREDCGNYWCIVVTDLRGQKLQEALRMSEAQVAAELADSKLLQSTSAELIHEDDVDAVFTKILEAAMGLMRSDMASMQMLDESEEQLQIVASRGFDPDFTQTLKLNDHETKSSCSAAMRTGRRVIVPDVETCEFIVGTPALEDHRKTGIRAVQSTPLLSSSGKLLGMLSTHWRAPHHPTERNLGLLDILARQAADLLERRRGEEAMQKWSTNLEKEVSRRTEELLESRERLRALASELSLAEHRERKRMATELHDYLAQLLVLAIMNLSQFKQKHESESVNTDLLNKAQELVSESLNYTRTLVAELTPPILHDFGLPAALKWLAKQMERYQLSVTVELSGQDDLKLPEEQALLLFQSIRELLINASKHSGAGEATVSLARGDDELQVEVRDRGKGFDIHAQATGDCNLVRFGLFSIRERMLALGGSFELESEPDKGTRALLILPLLKEHAAGVKVKAATSNLSESMNSHQPPPKNVQAIASVITTQTSSWQRPIRVLLVDDHAMVRQGLRSVLDSYFDIEVVGEASNGEEALAGIMTHQPTLVVMDINMPIMNGIEATAIIRNRYPKINVIGLSVQAGEEMQQAMLKAGANALLTKEAAVEQLYKTIRAVQCTERDVERTEKYIGTAK
jgi:PAS domain S-box-containing protein